MQSSSRMATGVAVLTCLVTLMSGCDIQSLPSVDNGDDPVALTHYISVARHEDVFLSTAQVDSIFESCTSLLETVEGPCPDVACPSRMTRDAEVTTFDITSSVVTSDADMDELFEHPADIKVVSLMVGVCGVSDPDDTTVVLGCAYSNGSAILSADAPADVWAHEWGHVQGLPHRNNCEANLMHAYEVETNAVNITERNAFLTASRGTRAARAIAPVEDRSEAFLATLRPRSEQSTEAWVDEIVDRNYLRGVPADVLSSASDPAITAALIDLLPVETDPVRQRNILRLLGLLKDPVAVGPVTAFLGARPGELSTAQMGVMAEALMALGRLSGNDASGAAMRWLVDGTEPQAWSDQGFTSNGQDVGQILARMAVMALGLSESPEAAQWVEQLHNGATTGRFSDARLVRQVEETRQRLKGTAVDSPVARRGALP